VVGGGVQDLAGWQRGLTSLGRLTGLAASALPTPYGLAVAELDAANTVADRSAKAVRRNPVSGLDLVAFCSQRPFGP
jgi:hypothetical protein